MRAYLEHGMHAPQPVKLYTVGPMYRYSAPQRGRYREHWQLSVEAIGTDDPAIDAELIALYADFLAAAERRRFELQLNSIGDRVPSRLPRAAGGLAGRARGRPRRRGAPKRATSLRGLRHEERDARGVARRRAEDRWALCAACRSTSTRYAAISTRSACPIASCRRSSAVSTTTRGRFEFVDEAIGAQSSICGGGRYDYLAEELGGKHTPGIGFGAGIERLLLSLGDAHVEDYGIDVFFVLEEGADRAATLAAMMELRRAGLACDADYAGAPARVS